MQRMIRLLSALLILFSVKFNASAQSVELSGVLVDCNIDSIRLFALDGGLLRPLLAVPLDGSDGTFKFSMALSEVTEGFYMLGGGNPQDTKSLILGKEKQLKVSGQCETLSSAKIWDSPANRDYGLVMKRADELQRSFSQQINAYRIASRKGTGLAEIEAEMKKIDAQKIRLLDSLKQANAFLSKVLALRTYLSYQTQKNSEANYKDESEYFAKSYFRYVDLTDPAYNFIPDLHGSFRSYSSTLPRLGLTNEAQKKYLQDILVSIPPNTSTHKMALLGSISGLKGKNDEAYVAVANEYITKYGRDQPRLAAQLQQEIASMQAQLIGGEAPEIHLPTPEGDSLRLTDLRGKVVLIDFWASWCGPCRRENPNVVRVYEKYKDKGFEILGVSLDRSKEPWLKAIEKDGLKWKHVSDLSSWQSVAARSYGVSAIPYTVLLDQEGKIIGKKLRGRALEQKLAEIFGE